MTPRRVSMGVRRKPVQRERGIQRGVLRLLKLAGCTVFAAGTTRAKPPAGIQLRTREQQRRWYGTRQTPGLPDLPLVFLPWSWVQGRPVALGLAVIEIKSEGGGLGPEQGLVRDLCRARGIMHQVFSSLDDCRDWLVRLGLARYRGIALHFPYAERTVADG